VWVSNPRGALITIKVSILPPSRTSRPPPLSSLRTLHRVGNLDPNIRPTPSFIKLELFPGGTVSLQRLWSHHRGRGTLAGSILWPRIELWAGRCPGSRLSPAGIQSRSYGQTERVREKARRREVVRSARQIHRNETRRSRRHLRYGHEAIVSRWWFYSSNQKHVHSSCTAYPPPVTPPVGIHSAILSVACLQH